MKFQSSTKKMTILQTTPTKMTDILLKQFETVLNKAIQFNFSDDRKILETSINYCVNSKGKRIRPLICMGIETCLSSTISISKVLGVAVELIHCYSLIHDDLPAMDNDDFRRGKPTCHKQFGEDIAILSGDVLNTYVFEYLATELPKFTSTENTLTVIKELSKACGANGMAGGQVLDLQSEISGASSFTELQTIHKLKTGALLKFCFEITTKIISNDENIIKNMSEIGEHFGLLFQIIDDIIDATGSFEEIGKSPGKDEQQKKLTYVSFLGIEKSISEAKKHYEIGIEKLNHLNKDTSYIESLFKFTLDKGLNNASNK